VTTRTRKLVTTPKKAASPARVKRRTVATKASRLTQSKAIPGLKGKGLLRLGSESKLELRARLSMPRQLFGRVVNVSERTIAKVESETDTAEKLKRPYNEVYRLLEALGDVVEVNSLGTWFQEPNDAFDGLKPMEVIERGEIDRLWNMVYELRSGMPG
jgi:DNA-binding XRE family transcriptional regulator